MIEVTKLRNGVTFEDNGVPYRVQTYEHTHLSRGGGTVKVRARNLLDGNLTTLTYKSTATVEEILIEKRKMQFLYTDGEGIHVMHPETFEQITLPKDVAGDQAHYLTEGELATVLVWDDDGEEKMLGLDLPPNLVYTVKETGSSEKGNTVSNVYKPAVLNNGLEVKVPMFIKNGDTVRVDTRSGEYVERVN